MLLNSAEKHQANTLLQIAERDLETVAVLVQHSPHLYESIGFYCQQAVEKLLKAALAVHQVKFPRTHDLTKLADLLPAHLKLSDELADEAAALNIFAVLHRYELDEAPGVDAALLVASANRFAVLLRPIIATFLA
jgi:HEPN domain-containing protein